MTKAKLKALEKVFGAEIEGRLPFQSRAKVYQELREMGLLESMHRVYGSGPLAVKVSGYELTHAGRMIYCAHCDGIEV